MHILRDELNVQKSKMAATVHSIVAALNSSLCVGGGGGRGYSLYSDDRDYRRIF